MNRQETPRDAQRIKTNTEELIERIGRTVSEDGAKALQYARKHLNKGLKTVTQIVSFYLLILPPQAVVQVLCKGLPEETRINSGDEDLCRRLNRAPNSSSIFCVEAFSS